VTEVNGEKYYTVAFDGSEYFHSTKINCPGDSRRESKRGGVAFPHVVVGATWNTTDGRGSKGSRWSFTCPKEVGVFGARSWRRGDRLRPEVS
jgi:hypothetical protein